MTMTINVEPAPIVAASSKAPAAKDVTTEKDYWNNFYSQFSVSIPSTWCVTTAIEADRSIPLVEFGCGNGRDSMYFASHGYTVYGCDLSAEAIQKNNKKAVGMTNLEFCQADVSDAEQVVAVIDKARGGGGSSSSGDGENITVYTRFFLHSIDKEQQDKFFAALADGLVAGDKLYFEYRCAMDESLDKVHGKEHYRRYIDTPAMMEELVELGFATDYEVTGRGMAKYKEEDPFVSRIIARKI